MKHHYKAPLAAVAATFLITLPCYLFAWAVRLFAPALSFRQHCLLFGLAYFPVSWWVRWVLAFVTAQVFGEYATLRVAMTHRPRHPFQIPAYSVFKGPHGNEFVSVEATPVPVGALEVSVKVRRVTGRVP